MDLYLATFIFSAILLVVGIPFLLSPSKSAKEALKLVRDKTAAIVLFGGAIVWFVWILMNLGEADFGDIKNILILVFGGAGILAFHYMPDFLAVRGASVLMLLLCRFFLDSAYMEEPASRLVMVSLAYIAVVVSIYMGSLPYRARDLFKYFEEKSARGRIFGLLCCSGALAMIVSSIFY